MNTFFPQTFRSSRRESALIKASGLAATLLLAAAPKAAAHTIDHHDAIPRIATSKIEFATVPGNRLVLGKKDGRIQALNATPVVRVAALAPLVPRPSSLSPLKATFSVFPRLRTRSDGRWFYVESDGMPDHNMMVGITAWQQQVPIPQPYTGDNAWQIPLNPVPARNPMSARSHFFRGAIALAVNGVPIYNPIKNDGRTDTFLAGELDNWGGHCGRGDDYHYHIAPVHLQDQVGRGSPLAWALDGYAVHGYTETDGTPVRNLDHFNGHDHGTGYHYHATKTYPYLNGGFHGEVREIGGQVDPQPRPGGIRPSLTPLRGAKITGFSGSLSDGFSVRYEIAGRPGYVNYKVAADRGATFTFIDPSGQQTTESHSPRNRDQGKRNRRSRPDDDRSPAQREMSEDELLDFFLGGRDGGRRPPPPKTGERPRGDNQRKGPPTDDDERKPWIAAHFAELDTDRDGKVSKAEMLAEAAKTFAGYDRNGDGRLTADEYSGRSTTRSAMGGFVKEHSAEFDTNNDKIITRDEADAFALRMFTKADRDGNNIVTNEEANTRGGGQGGGKMKRPR